MLETHQKLMKPSRSAETKISVPLRNLSTFTAAGSLWLGLTCLRTPSYLIDTKLKMKMRPSSPQLAHNVSFNLKSR